MYAACDRIESGIAVLVFDDGTVCDIPADKLELMTGRAIRERDILHVTINSSLEYGIESAAFDDAERDRRLNTARERLHRLAQKQKR